MGMEVQGKRYPLVEIKKVDRRTINVDKRFIITI